MQTPELPGYQIQRQLGQGGMAVVYLAQQDTFDRAVAIKVLASHLRFDPGFGDRFLREAQLVAQLNHPHIIPVYDVGRHGDIHYIAMEYLPGGDLRRRLRAGVAVREAIYIVKSIAQALDYAARKHCVHRDIKPENILFREDGSPVISDFGIAWKKDVDMDSTLNMSGILVGSPNYMSPEQSKGGVIDGRSDLYSLGVVLFEMLAGELPFRGGSPVAIELQRLTEAVPTLPESAAAFQGMMEKALARDPAGRFQSGAEFARALEDLERGLGSGPPTGVSPTGVPATGVPATGVPATGMPARARRRVWPWVALGFLLALGGGAWWALQDRGPAGLRGAGDEQSASAAGLSDAQRETFRQGLGQFERALASGDLEAAAGYLQTLEALRPEDRRLVALRSRLLEEGNLMARDQARQRFFEQQMAQAQEHIAAGDTLGAVRNLRSILVLAPDNAVAAQALAAQYESLIGRVADQIGGGELVAARESLAQLERLDPGSDALADLGAALSAAEAERASREEAAARRRAAAAREAAAREAAAREAAAVPPAPPPDRAAAGAAEAEATAPRSVPETEQQKLMARASALEAETRTAATNAELRALYAEVLALEPGHDGALSGLQMAGEFDLMMAEAALQERDYAAAAAQLAAVRASSPGQPGLEQAEARLGAAREAATAAGALLVAAREKMDQPYQPTRSNRVNSALRARLAGAYADIQAADQLDPGHPERPPTVRGLEARYRDAINGLLDQRRVKTAGELLADADWAKPGLADLQRRYERAAADAERRQRRPVGGSF